MYRKTAQYVDIAACISRVLHSMEMISAACCCGSTLLHAATMAAHQKVDTTKTAFLCELLQWEDQSNATSSPYPGMYTSIPMSSEAI